MEPKEEEELLIRLDERTKRIEEEHLRRLEKVERGVNTLEGKVDSAEQRIQRNETILKIMTGGLSGAIGLLGAKFSGIVHFLR